MDMLGKAFMFDLDEPEEQELEEGEQNLEDEAIQMLRSWDRNELMKEISDEKTSILNRDDPEKDYYDGETDFEELMADMTDISNERVFVKVLQANPEGAEIGVGCAVLIDMIGYVEYDPLPFESTLYEGKPKLMNLADGPIIPGLLAAILSMRQGESSNFLIHPAYAYGPLGAFPKIPKDAFLFYHIKIHKVWKDSDLEVAKRLERANSCDLPLELRIKLINDEREVANKFVQDNMLRDALIRYKAAIKYIEELPQELKESSKEMRTLQGNLYQNSAIVYNKLEMHKSASKAAKRALFCDDTNIKAHYQLVKARILLGDYAKALKYLNNARAMAPDSKGLTELGLKLDTHFRDEKKERDELMKRMSKALQ